MPLAMKSAPRTPAMGVILGLLLAATGVAETAAQPFAEGRLFCVSRPGVPASYVFGTIHVADPRVSRIPPAALDALERSRVLAPEIAPFAYASDDADSFEALQEGLRLEPLLSTAAYAAVRSELGAQGMSEQSIEHLKPWAAMLKVARDPDARGERSLDENLFLAARARQIHVESLESVEDQVSAFDSIPLKSQVALLEHAIAYREALAAQAEPTIQAWLHGDLAALARVPERGGAAMRTHYEALAKHVVQERTVAMHHRLFFPLRAGRVFVAVGASHLYGDAGLLALLRADGYEVTRLW